MSTPRGRVIAAAGRGAAARGVAAYAAREAAARGSVLEFLHVIGVDPPVRSGRPHQPGSSQWRGAATLEAAAQVAAEVAPGVPVVLTLVRGTRTDCLLTEALDATLVVIGAPGRPAPPAGPWPGTWVSAVVMAAPCPVVVVRGEVHLEPLMEWCAPYDQAHETPPGRRCSPLIPGAGGKPVAQLGGRGTQAAEGGAGPSAGDAERRLSRRPLR
ncbi:universal stress protein [Nocardioides sp.]|uniref:universal stress protein n=1 Tax=Nocardioides sp. TaxID=35761 RepID=UPI003D09F716